MFRKAGLVPSQFDAVAFDLDGVVTDTARIHFRAWKQIFDVFFEARSRRDGVAFVPAGPASGPAAAGAASGTVIDAEWRRH